ncbi:MAG: coiled-coil domain-containing protein, partial [Planctomycetota bacterium]
MRYLHPAVERYLDQASSQWRWLRFLQRSATLATVVTVLVLLLGVGMAFGWFTSLGWMVACFVLLVLAALFAWMLMGMGAAFAMADRPWLAASVERSHRPLLDRLNTLVFLERARGRRLQAYADRIEQQAREVLTRQPPPPPFSPTRVVVHLGMFAGVLTATILFYVCFHPLEQVRAASNNAALLPQTQEPFLEIPPLEEPARQLPEEDEEAPWGEIRISEPGHDLRATVLDIVPLRIEATASRPLEKVEWFTAVNGGAELRHELPAPDDPRYAVYQPELKLQDYALEEWDVLSYFARATTEDGQSYQSAVYFVELFPFREDLEELPEGPQHPGYTLLEQLTMMIERQQEVIRQTDRQQRLKDQPAADREKHHRDLAREEADLRQKTRHVGAAANPLRDSAPDGLEDYLGRAESTLEDAENSLLEGDLKEAGQHEQAALAQLVAARKRLQHLLRQPSNAFNKLADDLIADDPSGLLPESADRQRLAESAELQEMLDRQIEQYRRIEAQPEQFSPGQLQETTQETKEVLDRLQKLTDREQSDQETASELRRELSEQKKQQLEGQCDKLRQSQTSSEKGEAAGNLKGGLERLSRALATDNARRRAQINSDRLAEMQRQMEAAQSTMQSAREFVRQTLLAERNLEKRADPRRQTTLPALAEEQRQLNRSLEDFVRKNPQSFSRSQGQCSAAQSAMGKAAQSMADKSPDARQRAGQAADELQKLDDSLEQQQQHNRLADAYELKRMLDEQISQLGQCQRHGAGAGQRQQLARQSRSITGQLKQIAEQEPTSGQFGAELREALSDENKRQLDAQSDRL